MGNNQDPSFRGIIIITISGVLVSIVVLFSIYISLQQAQNDPYFSSEENVAYQKIIAVKNIRREIAEEFIAAVVNCISPPILPGQILTEQQVNERVTTAIENSNTKNEKCENNKNPHLTFELPCKLKINKSSYNMGVEINLGFVSICKNTIAKSILSTINSCTTSSKFTACLVSSVLANDDVKKEIDKPVESQAITDK